MGQSFNSFLIGYFFGMHFIYLIPERYYHNFKQRVALPLDKEYKKPDYSYIQLVSLSISGFLDFTFGKESIYQDLMDYIEKRSSKENSKK